jgi:hypothetical protein
MPDVQNAFGNTCEELEEVIILIIRMAVKSRMDQESVSDNKNEDEDEV